MAQETQKIVSVLGCGWLGLPLAIALHKAGCFVKGSTTREDKQSLLDDHGIQSYVLICSPQVEGFQKDGFFSSDILIITLPFKRTFPDPDFYFQQIRSIMDTVETSPINWVIFTGSTSVYPLRSGKVSESSSISPEDPRAETLLKIEQYLLNTCPVDATVLRLGGLTGGKRRIGKFLAAKKEMVDGPVNLIHLVDCVNIIVEIVRKNLRQEIFNLVCDAHPLKSELYVQKARESGLSPPEFRTDRLSSKIVCNDKIKSALSYEFVCPNPLEFAS